MDNRRGRYAARRSYQALKEEREKLMSEMRGRVNTLRAYIDPSNFTPQRIMKESKGIYEVAKRIGGITAMLEKAGGLVNKVMEVFSASGQTMWRSPIVPSKEAAKLLTAIGNYNDFDGPEVASYVTSWQGIKWEVGREYSPVLYAHGIKDLFTAEDIASTFKMLKADEITLSFGSSVVWSIEDGVNSLPEGGYRKATMRIWWD